MTLWIGLLRAINVGGTGKLPMAELRALCADLGFRDVQTYIASGNLLFRTEGSEAQVQTALESRLQHVMGKPADVFLRSPNQMQAILAANPFPDAPGNRVMVSFLHDDPPADLDATVRHRTDEDIVPGDKVIYTHYPGGMGRSKLLIPAATQGTARNLNTVAKLVEMAAQASRS